jgi:hypothetical protein
MQILERRGKDVGPIAMVEGSGLAREQPEGRSILSKSTPSG